MPGDVRNAALFSALALGLSLAVVLLVSAPTDILIMSTPAIAALVMMLVVTREGYTKAGWARLGLHRLGLRWWALAAIGTAFFSLMSWIERRISWKREGSDATTQV